MPYYFIKGRITGKKDEDYEDFYDVFQGTLDAKVELDDYVAAVRTKRNRIPLSVDIYTFNRV
jgi:hypothetical protein